MFEYGFLHGIAAKTKENGVRVVKIPASRVIQLKENAPDTEILRIIFPDGTPHDFKIQTFNLLDHDIQELEDLGLALLFPFYILKLQDALKKALGGTERKQLYAKMSGLLDTLFTSHFLPLLTNVKKQAILTEMTHRKYLKGCRCCTARCIRVTKSFRRVITW